MFYRENCLIWKWFSPNISLEMKLPSTTDVLVMSCWLQGVKECPLTVRPCGVGFWIVQRIGHVERLAATKTNIFFQIYFINLWLTDPDLRAVDKVINISKINTTCTFNLQVRRWVVFADVSGFELAGVSHPLSVLANLKAALVFATRAGIFVILIEIALNLQFQWCLSHLKL